MPQLFMLTCKTRTLISSKPSLGFNKNTNQQHGCTIHQPISSTCTYGYDQRSCLLRTQFVPITKAPSFYLFQPTRHKFGVSGEDIGAISDEDDDDLCPVDCVKEFKTDEEFFRILEKAKENDALVVVDFYRPSCGSCKYIEQGFAKLCRRAGDNEAPVIFLKHNVIDEYDEQSEVAERLRIKTVPLFHFYKGGVLLEAFPTRDKERITSAILKYSSPATKAI